MAFFFQLLALYLSCPLDTFLVFLFVSQRKNTGIFFDWFVQPKLRKNGICLFGKCALLIR
jgi:hypothetical protein